MALTLGFHGAAGTVTGSRFLIEANGQRILVDCGLFQGLKDLRERNWQPMPFQPNSVDAVILTHAHIDHSGYLPRLVRLGYRGPIYCTHATAELLKVLLLDAARLQEEDAVYANRKGYSRHRPAEPLYTETDAVAALARLRAIDYETVFAQEGFRARFHNAGHILGSAFVEVEADTGSGTSTLVFSGDLGQYDAALHPDPDPLPACDTLVLESTYGDREHDNAPFIDQIRAPFLETVARKGIVLIPAFAVARAQILTLLIREMMSTGNLPRIPVHIDSPMAVEVTDIYGHYLGSEELDPDVLGDGDGRLFPASVRFHSTVEESRQLNSLGGPRVIISSSGMLTGGRVLHHLRRLLPDPDNLIVLAGYQAVGTRGRALQEGAKSLRVHGEDIPARARTVNIDGLSAHADRPDLLRWLSTAPAPPATVFLTHGEPRALEDLAGAITQRSVPALTPRLFDTYSFDTGSKRWQHTGGRR